MEDVIGPLLYNFCREFIELRSSRLQKNMADMRESLESETKSSAGDKHETGRAMIQLELEKLGKQLEEIQKVQDLFKRVPRKGPRGTIGLGSIVRTCGQHYYMGISAGALQLGKDTYYAVAPNSPIGMLLMGKKVGDRVLFNGKEFTVIGIG
jgi:hypothetical protein